MKSASLPIPVKQSNRKNRPDRRHDDQCYESNRCPAYRGIGKLLFACHQLLFFGCRQNVRLAILPRTREDVLLRIFAIPFRQHPFARLRPYRLLLRFLDYSVLIEVVLSEITVRLKFPLTHQIFHLPGNKFTGRVVCARYKTSRAHNAR